MSGTGPRVIGHRATARMRRWIRAFIPAPRITFNPFRRIDWLFQIYPRKVYVLGEEKEAGSSDILIPETRLVPRVTQNLRFNIRRRSYLNQVSNHLPRMVARNMNLT